MFSGRAQLGYVAACGQSTAEEKFRRARFEGTNSQCRTSLIVLKKVGSIIIPMSAQPAIAGLEIFFF